MYPAAKPKESHKVILITCLLSYFLFVPSPFFKLYYSDFSHYSHSDFFSAAAQRACYLRLVRICWSNWRNALHRRWIEEERLQAAGQLAIQMTQRRALERWRACILINTISVIFIPAAASYVVYSKIVSSCNHQNNCWILELVRRCDTVQRRN